MDQVVRGAAARAEARADVRALARLADQRKPDRHYVLGQAEQLVEDALLVGMPDERACEPFVNRCFEHEQHQRAGVDEPVRHRPGHLDATGPLQLVRLVVTRVVERFVRGDHHVHRRVGDEVAAVRRVVVVAEGFGDLRALLGVGDDDDAAALTEAARRRVADDVRDALDLLARQRVGQERAVHAAAAENVAELHGANLYRRVHEEIRG